MLKVARNIKNCLAGENSRFSSFLAALDVFLVAKLFSLAKTCPKLQKLLKSCRTWSFLLMQLTEQSVHCHWELYLSFDAICCCFSLAESPPRGLQITTYTWWSAHAQCRDLCLAANNILFMRKHNHSFLLAIALAWKVADRLVKLGFNYRRIPWFVIVSQINYLPKPKVATDKSRHFSQPRSIIVNYYSRSKKYKNTINCISHH